MEQSSESVWSECLELIRDNVSSQNYKTWFEPLKAIRLEDKQGARRLTVQLPSRFYYEWLEEHYFSLLRKTITKVLGPQGRLYYDVVIQKEDRGGAREGASVQLPARSVPDSSEAPTASHRSSGNGAGTTGAQQQQAPLRPQQGHFPNPFAIPGLRKQEIDSRLNAEYTFDRFIEGDCNQLARNAALAIGEEPGATSFNPFLVYGGVGLGKTHLIHAIGNYARHNRTVDTALYVSSERFTNEFVQSIQHNRVSEFSLFYRQIDLLIVDDIQFFGGKEKTQEEFFHIFNALHQSGKQIVLSADRSPREIEGIEERLLSRFQWGLSADVKAPGLETRTAILQRKAEDDGIEIPPEVIEFIAHNIKSNIRELEGSLIRLLAHGMLHKREIDLPLAKDVLRDLIRDTRANLTIEEIQRIVCAYFDTPEDQVRAKTRKREIVRTRQIAMFFCKEFTQHSLKTIGLHFGGRDHSTVIHANQTVENQIDVDPKYEAMIDDIRGKISLRSI